MPTQKALGKRKMTLEQVQAYYRKTQKIERNDDSDEEQSGIRPPVRRAAHGGLTLERQDRLDRLDRLEPREPVEVHPEDEHARDLLEALNRPISDVVPVEIRDACENIVFSDDLDLSDL